MIVQPPAEAGEPSFVILQNDHTAFAGELARHFGNERFARLEPSELVDALVSWHDEGWTEIDDRFLPDPTTGLPYNLISTPLPELIGTTARSAAKGEARHPFIGLLASKHACGLYNGRDGLVDLVILDLLPPEVRSQVDPILAAEAERQERLRSELRADPATAALAEDAVIHRTFNALQLFDMFALYVQCEHPSRHAEATFPSVPVDDDPAHDVTITATPLGRGRYRLDPYPFDLDPFEPATAGRYLEAQPPGTDLAAVWAAAEPAEQRISLGSDASAWG